MRKLLLSTVSVAALVTLAACSDETADATDPNDNPAAVEESAGIDTTVPSAEDNNAVATAPAEQPADGMQTDDGMTAQAETAPPATGDQMPAETAEADSIDQARQAIVNAQAAIDSGASDQALQAIDEAEAAIEDVQEAADAQQAIDDARTAVQAGEFEEASAALDEVRTALEQASQQAAAPLPTSDETTASTSQ